MRLPARTLLVLVLCLAALVGASAQASFFSSFFRRENDGSGEDWEDSEDAFAEAARLEEDTALDARLRALMADAASFGAGADGIRDADFEAADDAFLEVALVDEDDGVEPPAAAPDPPGREISRKNAVDERVEDAGLEDADADADADVRRRRRRRPRSSIFSSYPGTS